MDDELLVTADDVNQAQQRANMVAAEFREQEDAKELAQIDMVSELETTFTSFAEELRVALPGAVSFSAQRINRLTGAGEVTEYMTLLINVNGARAAGFSEIVQTVLEV